ncbi:MAG: hypothetical protein Q7J98_07875 [Kiritimatiellia bacterium]|nr:hypothetical protein [Kiritimatiellia bacterium]
MKPCPLNSKPDWPDAAQRWTAFWKDEVPKDRVLMAIKTPRLDNPYPKPKEPENYEDFHVNLDFVIARRLHEVYSAEYLAEAIPAATISITGGYLGILLGGKLRPMANGIIWSEPFIADWDSVDVLRIDRSSRWYKLALDQLALFREHSRDFLTLIPDFHGVSDALVSVRGAQDLAFDLVDQPEQIKRAGRQIVAAWLEAYNEAYDYISGYQAGSVIWFNMWHPGRCEAIQEDFADLLSPEQYRQFFMQPDREFSRHIDKAMFHLHNTMTRLQEVTLEMPEIAGTQFRLPYDADRNPVPLNTQLDLYRRMHRAGKKTWYAALDEADLQTAILNSDPRHLYLIYPDVADAADANRIMTKACELTQRRIKELGL